MSGRHSVLVSADLAFHERIEGFLREEDSAAAVSRVHPDAGGDALTSLLGRAATRLFLDASVAPTSRELVRAIRKFLDSGGRATTVAELPRQARQAIAWADQPVELLFHNARWDSRAFSSALLGSPAKAAPAVAPARAPGARLRGEGLLTHSRQKPDLLFSLDESLEDAGVARTRRERAIAVTDELLMNALYDAPDDAGVTRDRGEARLSWSLAGGEFTVTVRDPFGSLRADVLAKRVASFFRLRKVEVSRRGRGAGIGLYLVLRNASSCSFLVERGEASEISARLDLGEPRPSATLRKKEILARFRGPARS
jgi:hypothetical protein